MGLKVLFSALASQVPTCTDGPLVVRLSWQKDGVDSVLPLGRRLWARAPWVWVRVEEVGHSAKSFLCARHCLNSFNPHSNNSELGTNVTPILQTRKLRLRCVK